MGKNKLDSHFKHEPNGATLQASRLSSMLAPKLLLLRFCLIAAVAFSLPGKAVEGHRRGADGRSLMISDVVHETIFNNPDDSFKSASPRRAAKIDSIDDDRTIETAAQKDQSVVLTEQEKIPLLEKQATSHSSKSSNGQSEGPWRVGGYAYYLIGVALLALVILFAARKDKLSQKQMWTDDVRLLDNRELISPVLRPVRGNPAGARPRSLASVLSPPCEGSLDSNIFITTIATKLDASNDI